MSKYLIKKNGLSDFEIRSVRETIEGSLSEETHDGFYVDVSEEEAKLLRKQYVLLEMINE